MTPAQIILRAASSGLGVTPLGLHRDFPQFEVWQLAQCCDALALQGWLVGEIYNGKRVFFDKEARTEAEQHWATQSDRVSTLQIDRFIKSRRPRPFILAAAKKAYEMQQKKMMKL